MSVSNVDLVQAYCQEKSSALSDKAIEIRNKTMSSRFNERLLVDMVGARFLSFITHLLRPESILEIGTFSGFSAQILSEGLADGGSLYTLEIDEDHYQFAVENLKDSPNNNSMHLLLGDAIELIPTLDKDFDLIFLDAAKRQYTKHYEAALSKLRTGGMIIADNALWKNRVVLEEADNMTKGVQEFNNYVKADERVRNVLVPIGDGMNLITKI